MLLQLKPPIAGAPENRNPDGNGADERLESDGRRGEKLAPHRKSAHRAVTAPPALTNRPCLLQAFLHLLSAAKLVPVRKSDRAVPDLQSHPRANDGPCRESFELSGHTPRNDRAIIHLGASRDSERYREPSIRPGREAGAVFVGVVKARDFS